MHDMILQVTGMQTKEWTDAGRNEYWPLEVFTKKSAHLLNAVIHYIISKLDTKIRYNRSWNYKSYEFDASAKVGGGLIVRTHSDVTVDPLGEVGLHMNNVYAISSFCKKGDDRATISSTVRDRLASLLKKMWKESFTAKDELGEECMEISTNPIFPEKGEKIKIRFSEYRTLYEHLKGRDHKKTARIYGDAAQESMIGEPVMDQMVISAVETIENEIAEVNKAAAAKSSEINEEMNAKLKEIRLHYQDLINEVTAARDVKVKELTEQKTSMICLVREAV